MFKFQSATGDGLGLFEAENKRSSQKINHTVNPSSFQKKYQLELFIDQAFNLSSSDSEPNSSTSFFMSIKLNNIEKVKTKVKKTKLNKNTYSPIFKETHQLEIENPSKDIIQFTIYENANEPLYTCSFEGLDQLTKLVYSTFVFDLNELFKSNKKGGKEQLQIDLRPLNFGVDKDDTNIDEEEDEVEVNTNSNLDTTITPKKKSSSPWFSGDNSTTKTNNWGNNTSSWSGNSTPRRKKSNFAENFSPLGLDDDVDFVISSCQKSNDENSQSTEGITSMCPFAQEGEKEFTKTKQQFKLLYIMAIDIQTFGEKVVLLEKLMDKLKKNNRNEKLTLNNIKISDEDFNEWLTQFDNIYHQAERKRDLLFRFLPKLSKKLPKVTNCKLTLMKLQKLNAQFQFFDEKYQNFVKEKSTIERKWKKKRMEQLIDLDQFMDQVIYQQDEKKKENVEKNEKQKIEKNNDDKRDLRLKEKEERQQKQKELFLEAIKAGAKDSGVEVDGDGKRKRKYTMAGKDTLSTSPLGLQQQLLVDNNNQQKIEFILSTSDKQIIEIEEKIAKETKQELEQVERDYNELHQMFVDLNTLIREQGEGLHIAEENVRRANVAVVEGTEYVKAASALTTTGFLTGGFTKAAILKKLIQ